MGLAIAFLLAGAVLLGLLVSGRCSRAALELVLVALLVGIAGYGWQGHPDLPGHPFAPASATP